LVSYGITAVLNIKISFERIRDVLKIKTIGMKDLNDDNDPGRG
jgi:hypothetical protein